MAVWTMLGLGVALAQVNVEPITSASTEPGWSAKANAGFGFSAGNVQYTDLLGSASLRFVTAHPDVDPESEDVEGSGDAFRDRLVLSGNVSQRNYSSGLLLDSRFVHLRYTRMSWRRFGGEVFTQVGNDRFLLQQWRIVAGAGVRAVLVDAKEASVVFGTGYMYEWEDRNISEDAPDPRYERDHRSTSYLSLKLFPVQDRVTVQNIVYFQPRWDAPADLQLLNDFTLTVKLSEALSLTSSLFLRYDSRPPSELVPLDVRTNNGLSLTL